MKRKSGSKDMIKWLNQNGHGISCDEVNVIETFLAEEAFKNQTSKSFCSATVQPSVFVTFIWDNNDVNPESLSGNVMHCTNGIIVQLQSDQIQHQNQRFSEISIQDKQVKRRSFKPIHTIQCQTTLLESESIRYI